MKKITSFFIAFTVLLTSIGLESSWLNAYGSNDLGSTVFNDISYDASEIQATDNSNDESISDETIANEGEEGALQDTTTSAAIEIQPMQAPQPLQSTYVSTYARGSSQITFTKEGTITHPLINVSIDTGGYELVGITYERGYNLDAGYESERIYEYNYDESTGIATFTLDNVIRYLSVMAVLYDPSTKTTVSIESKYELTGKRVYNAGSSSFSAYPLTPLTDDSSTVIRHDKVSDTTQGGDNGPIAVIEGETWLGGNNGNFDVLTRENLDAHFGLSSTSIPKATISTDNFHESASSIIYDGRYVIVRSNSNDLAIIEASTKTVVATGANSDTQDANVETVIKNYKTLNGKISALAYDNTDIYILSTEPKLYVARRQSDGTYILDTTALYTLANTSMNGYLDMTYDGDYLWMTHNNPRITKYHIDTGVANTIGTNIDGGNGNVSKVIYDGKDHVYTIGIQAVATESWNGLKKINRNDDSVTRVYTDNSVGVGYYEDINFDGRNVWLHSFSQTDSNKQRYDTVENKRVVIPNSLFNGNNYGNSAGVYDGKYNIFYNYNFQDINVVGREDTYQAYIKFGDNEGSIDSNLQRYFSENPLLEEDSVVYVDDLETTSPNYVDIKTIGAKSSSDIVFAAWAYDKTDAKDIAFFKDMNNYANDSSYEDWTYYLNNINRYYEFSDDELPTLASDGSFNFSMKALPKLNGVYSIYMVNADGKVIVESINIDNYKEMGKINIYVIEVDSTGKEIKPTNYVVKDIDMSNAVGLPATISIEAHLKFIEEGGYLIYGATSRVVDPIPLEGVEYFYVEKDKTKWTEIIKKPYYLDGSGNKVYIGEEINTGLYYLVSEEGTMDMDYATVVVDAPHVKGYSINRAVDGIDGNSHESIEVKLPPENGGTKDTFGRTVVEFEYVSNEKIILVTGIEVDENNEPTGKLVYTEQVVGGEGETTTINAKTGLENWDLVGLVNYDSGSFSSVSEGTSLRTATFGVHDKVDFAYKRKMIDITVQYTLNDGTVIDTEDVYTIPTNTDYTFVAKAIDGYKLADSSSYSHSQSFTTSDDTIQPFVYVPLTENIIINARLDSETGTILARDSVSANLGGSVDVSADGLVNMLSPRYALDTTKTPSPETVNPVEVGSVVDFVFVEKKTAVTVNYVDAAGNSIATKKTYNVFYGDTITEDARSIDNYYFDTASGDVSVSKTADSDTENITFKYLPSKGAVTVMAQDAETGEILAYHVENGPIGTKLNVADSDVYFTNKGDTFLSYYTISGTKTQEATYSENHQTLVFNYKINKFTVTVTAKENNASGNQLSFFDNTTSKVFTYKQGSTYSIYAPPVTGYKALEPKVTTNTTGITENTTFEFYYEAINTEVNLVVKAVSEDGSILVKSKVVSGDRGVEDTIDILDGSYLTATDLENWTLADDQQKTATYGTDREVIFKFTRNTVKLTVNFIEVDGAGDTVKEIGTPVVYTEDTNSIHTVFARHFNGYELHPDQDQLVKVNIGTSDLSIDIKYVKASGNVIVIAVDKDTRDILEAKYYAANVGDAFTFDLSTQLATDFKTYTSIGYSFVDPGSNPSITVDADAAKNQIELEFTKKMATITVKYLDVDGNPIKDEDGNVVESDKVYTTQYGTTVKEHAVNIDYYNLSSDEVVNYEVTGDKTIIFTYQKVDYTIVTDGVVNVIAKDKDNGNIIAMKSFAGTIGEQAFFDATAIFGTITGYELDDTQVKDAVYDNGYINLEFTYKPVNLNITIVAKDTEGATITLTDNVISVQQGDTITVNAPHIDNYAVVGDTSKTFENVTEVQTAEFIYEPIGQLIVGKGIEVDENGAPTGNTVYVEIKNGDQSNAVTFTAKTLTNWDLVGLYNSDGTITEDTSSKSVIYGSDDEVVFAYTRKMVDVVVKYIEDGTGVELAKSTYNVPLNEPVTLTARAIEGYKLKDPNSFEKVFTPTGNNTPQPFVYIKLTEGVAIEARLGSETGKLLAATSKDYPLGSTDVKVEATELNTMLSPRYILDPSTQSPYTLSTVTTDSKVIFIYKEQTSNVVINYVDGSGNKIATSKTYTVPYGHSIRESARSIDNYYLDTEKSTLNFNVTSANQSTHTYDFVYKNGAGTISVIAKDIDSGAILYYKTYNGTQGNNFSFNSETVLWSEDFVDYYTLDTSDTVSKTMTFSSNHQEMTFLYKKDVYDVTISAALNSATGEALTFYDGSTSMTFTYTKGDKYTVYAPPVIGYQVKENTAYFISGQIANSFTFIYEKIDTDENLSIKAVSSDGKYIIGSKVITGERAATASIKITDYEGEIYNSNDWTLVGEDTKAVTYGFDNEVIFTFSRDEVNLTINHIIEPASGGESTHSTETIKVGTNSSYNSTAILIDDYQLKSTEKFAKVTQIGTSDVVVEYRYEPISGNILINAVDSDNTNNILMIRGANGTTNTSYTVTAADLAIISEALKPGYEYDTTSNDTLDNVSSDPTKNIITLKYKKVLSDITVKYVDDTGADIFPPNTYQALYGSSINEYAVNINFYNLTSTSSFVKIDDVNKASYEIVFEYKLVDYTIVTDGVVNVIAKVADGEGGYKILDFKSFNGTIGESETFDANEIFGEITGYKLVGDPKKSETYVSGFVVIEYIYEITNLTVTIKAIDTSTGEVLTFSEQAVFPVIEGGNLTVYAPHITSYEVSGSSSRTLTKITANQEVIFEYFKIAVPSVITVRHISFVNGYQVAIKNTIYSGNIGEVIKVGPLDASEVLALGYEINPSYNYTKNLLHGSDKEFVFLYDRVMSRLEVNHNVWTYERNEYGHNVLVSDTPMTEDDKMVKARNLLDINELVERDTNKTVVAPFDENYVIDIYKNKQKLRQTIYMGTSHEVIDYDYRNITGNILVRAVVEDPKGTLDINGTKYSILAQVDDWIEVGDSYDSTKANKAIEELDNMLDSPYIFNKLLSGDESFTMVSGENYNDHTITYEYTADYKDVRVFYYDEDGSLLAESLLGNISNPQIIRVIKGEFISQYALNVQNYNFYKSSITVNSVARALRTAGDSSLTDKVYYNEQVNDDLNIGFTYKKIDVLQQTRVTMFAEGVHLGSENIFVAPGQTLYAPYRAGYEPTITVITVGDTVSPEYSFDYVKIKPTVINNTNTVTIVDRDTEYDIHYVYVRDEVDHSGTAFDHNKYVNGYPDGSIKPDKQITRGEVVVMLYNILYDKNVDKNNYPATDLSDVDQDEWYAKAVNYMTKKKYVNGYENGTFQPQKNISRAELATILSNIFATNSNNDINALPLDPNKWSTPFIVKAFSSGLYNGFNLYQYDFDELATRAEVIVMINNGENRIPNEDYLSKLEAPSDLTSRHWAYYHILEAMNSHSGHYEGNFGKEFEVIE